MGRTIGGTGTALNTAITYDAANRITGITQRYGVGRLGPAAEHRLILLR